MQMINSCPCCSGPLVNDFVPTKNKKEFLKKSCNKKLDHKFSIQSFADNHDEIERVYVTVDTGKLVTVVWDLLIKELYVTQFLGYPNLNYTTKKSAYRLPYTDPDLSDYPKLVRRIKTYIVFS
jgi:hypothetical protein